MAAVYVAERGLAAGSMLATARAHDSDLILMGGYGHAPLKEVMLGSTVDEVLRRSQRPALICR